MTEKELDLYYKVQNEYYTAFSKLVAMHVDKMPPHLHAETLMMLQEGSSVYGSCYDKYLKVKND